MFTASFCVTQQDVLVFTVPSGRKVRKNSQVVLLEMIKNRQRVNTRMHRNIIVIETLLLLIIEG